MYNSDFLKEKKKKKKLIPKININKRNYKLLNYILKTNCILVR